MSFKYRVERQSQGHYVLPRIDPMQVAVHAFLSEALFEQTDEGLWQQAVESASYDGVIGVYLMPDTHLGYGIPVGGVVVTDETIIQSGSGYDISCGVTIRGIVGNTERTPLDECGHVYKDLDAVLDVLEGEGIARVERRLFPVANIKGTD